jgi:hypothetical protein
MSSGAQSDQHITVKFVAAFVGHIVLARSNGTRPSMRHAAGPFDMCSLPHLLTKLKLG